MKTLIDTILELTLQYIYTNISSKDTTPLLALQLYNFEYPSIDV